MSTQTQETALKAVETFLERMEARDLEGAKALLSDEFAMVFPGGASFLELGELIAWAKPRYRWVKKTFYRWDVTSSGDEATVICQGTLYGEFPDGSTFENIRFIDWFLVRNGKLHRQHVWNDLGEYRLKQD